MANTRVKVPRTVLIERIQETIDKATAAHEAALIEYEKLVTEFFVQLPLELEKEVKRISALSADEGKKYLSKMRDYSDSCYVRVKLSLPHFHDSEADYSYRYSEGSYRYTRHDFEGYIKQLEKSKRVLEASTEELISVAANDEYADYL